ncbi:MAG: hypothetical protein EON52_07520, partial [Actinomycetales bacterium]
MAMVIFLPRGLLWSSGTATSAHCAPREARPALAQAFHVIFGAATGAAFSATVVAEAGWDSISATSEVIARAQVTHFFMNIPRRHCPPQRRDSPTSHGVGSSRKVQCATTPDRHLVPTVSRPTPRYIAASDTKTYRDGMSTFLYELGRWSFRHHTRVIVAWFVVLLVGAGAAAALGEGTRNQFDIPGTEANDAFAGLARTFPELSGVTAYVVVVAPEGGSMTSATSKRLVEQTVDRIDDVKGVGDATSPYDDMVRSIAVSPDEKAVQIQVQLKGKLEDVTPKIKSDLQGTAAPLEQADYDKLSAIAPTIADVVPAGAAADSTAAATWQEELAVIGRALGREAEATTLTGQVEAAFRTAADEHPEFAGKTVSVVLYRMFRSFRTAVMPIATAVIGVVVTVELIWTATGFFTVSATAPLLALMIGLAVGIDYALFI